MRRVVVLRIKTGFGAPKWGHTRGKQGYNVTYYDANVV
jgi:hypothetical protein